MQPTTSHPTAASGSSLVRQQKGNPIWVEQCQYPAGEANCFDRDTHTIFLSLAARPVRLLQIHDGKAYQGLYRKGDISIAPANQPLFARWESDDHYLQMGLAAGFVDHVARETLNQTVNSLEIVPSFQIRDAQIESIGRLLLAELQEHVGSQLYLESLANVLAVHLLRQYMAAPVHLPVYQGGLAQRQLGQVLEYVHAHLDQDIKLADLATLLDMSQFHFSHLFKQSLGISPYQYLLHQRIERAKQLLKQTDRAIVEIALMCGFNSHSHLSKQFRQLTGQTPRAYRNEA